ncbi:ECF-type sigma factor [Glaciecola sp. SC05]|uniref:ECF-type sigma factor n=1 Tax=Glaciecola sp. SC05 TaxID=1987355 RepID=UPI0035281066
MQDPFTQAIQDLPAHMQSALLAELNQIAHRYMLAEHAGHTLQATALVNEVYVNMAGKNINVDSKSHFIALAAQNMRRILVDHARAKTSAKRGNRPIMVTLAEAINQADNHNIDLIYLDKLLIQLSNFDQRAAQIFELKLFSSLTNDEIAKVLALSNATVERDLKAAKAWLKHQMQSTFDEDESR